MSGNARDFEILKERIIHAVKAILPGPEEKGDPFWTIMEVKDGQTTGSYHTQGKCGERKILPLFIDRATADRYCAVLNRNFPEYQVRGVSRQHLKALVAFQDLGRIRLGICLEEVNDGSEHGFKFVLPEPGELKASLRKEGYSV